MDSPHTIVPEKPGPRSLSDIAHEIRRSWPKVNYAAEPYLQAMFQLDSVHDSYGCDSAQSIVLYFLCNAKSWRGDTARLVKAELRALVA